MKKFIIDMFSSKEGVSHKRVLGALGFISLIVYMFIYQTDISVEAVEYTTIVYGLGTVAEKFSSRKNKEETEEPVIEQIQE
jgi:hypothetical protein